MLGTFIGCSIGLLSSNFIYQAMCDHPDWVAASERTFFQAIALFAVGVALAIRSINA